MSKNHFIRTFETMQVLVYNNRFIVALACAALLLLCSCKKTVENISQQTAQQYFESTILNKQFVVAYATDNSTEITSNFSNDTFILKKGTTYYDGPMTGTRTGIIYTGTWTSNEDYSKLDISITTPAPPAEYVFLNRSWKFTKKSLPVMELAPWGTAATKILHMRRL